MPTKPPGPVSDADTFLHVQTRRAGKIKGEATTDGHVDDIEVRSLTWGVAASSAIGSTAATGRRQYKHLVIVKRIDSASTALLAALATNDEVKEATLTLRKAGGDALPYYTIKLGGGRIVSIDLSVDEEAVPVETVGIAYTQIEVEYRRQQSAGMPGASTSFNDEVLPAQ